MKTYLIITMIFVIGFSLVQAPFGYSLDNMNNSNSFTYYEKSCKNDSCVVTTCTDGQACNTSGYENSTTSNNDTQSPLADKEGYDSNNLDFMNFWKNFLNFDR